MAVPSRLIMRAMAACGLAAPIAAPPAAAFSPSDQPTGTARTQAGAATALSQFAIGGDAVGEASVPGGPALAIPPAFDLLRGGSWATSPADASSPDPAPSPGLTMRGPQVLGRTGGRAGSVLWDFSLGSLPLTATSPSSDTAVPLGQLTLGYNFGPITFFGAGSIVPDLGEAAGRATYLQGGANLALPMSFTLGARIGYQWTDTVGTDAGALGGRGLREGLPGDGMDWSLSLSREWLGFNMSIQVGDGEGPADSCSGLSMGCNPRVFMSIDRRF